MKKIMLLLAVFIGMNTLVFAQQKEIPSAKPGTQYGEKITAANAISVAQLNKKLENSPAFNGKVEGKVVQVCKKKGCFITLENGNNTEPVMVRFKDYGFFMPQDIVGKTVVLEGTAKIKETSVEALKHNAKDLKKSQEEIDKITQPEKYVTFVANGVVVK